MSLQKYIDNDVYNVDEFDYYVDEFDYFMPYLKYYLNKLPDHAAIINISERGLTINRGLFNFPDLSRFTNLTDLDVIKINYKVYLHYLKN